MSESEPPFVTIVIPVRNEAAFIEQSLACVLAQDYPMSQVEILVAEGYGENCDDELIRLMSEMRRKAVPERRA